MAKHKVYRTAIGSDGAYVPVPTWKTVREAECGRPHEPLQSAWLDCMQEAGH
jgi:hypothetical protein